MRLSECVSSQCDSLPDSSEDVMEVTDFWLLSVGTSAAGSFSSGSTSSLRSGIGVKPRTLEDIPYIYILELSVKRAINGVNANQF